MHWNNIQKTRLKNLFLEGFTAMDIAEPLASFDHDADTQSVRAIMLKKGYDIAGIRRDGQVCGFIRQEDLNDGPCSDYLQPFSFEEDMVRDTASLVDVVKSLSINGRCFVTILDKVGAIITLSDLEKPPMRMFLFGMITISEMLITDILRQRFPDNSWQEFLSANRLMKAKEMQAERERRGQPTDLLDCLQFGDKGWIITYDDELRQTLGQTSRKEARKAVKEFETLRNNLAHTQAIIPSGWQRIVIACSRWEENMGMILERISHGQRKNS